jgi:lysophospholipase L1-like esterase
MHRRLVFLSLLLPLSTFACGEPEDLTDSGGETEAADSGETGGGEGDGTETGDGDGDTTTGGGCEIVPVRGDQVVMLGDSYLAVTSVAETLFTLARGVGALGPTEEYRRYDAGGTQMGNGQIPAQFDQAVAENPDIKTVIMTGGGNDVLIGDANICLQTPPPDPTCVARIDDVLNAAEGFMQAGVDAGVENVVYFFYPHLPEGGLVQGFKNETLDYAAPLVEEMCNNAPVNCIFVDPRPAFEGHPEYFLGDGIHPNAMGSVILANTIWSVMVANCIGQAAP